MKLLRTIRFDDSDTHVFPVAAEAGEWAVSGASLFADVPPEALSGKLRQAFANGFLGTASLGHATFVVVAHLAEVQEGEIASALARLLVVRLGAPSLAVAETAAAAEVSFAADLCRNLNPGTVLAVARAWGGDGSIAEKFRLIGQPSGASHDPRLWSAADDA